MASKPILLLLCLTLGTYIQPFAQKVSEEHRLMNMEERITYLKSNVKKYDQQPLYRLNINSKNAYKVMINGFPVGNNFGDIATNLDITVNHAILESGDQQVEIQVYPEYNADGATKALSAQDFFSLSIVRTASENGKLKEPESVYEFNLQDQEEYAGETVFIFKDHFKAAVPYRLSGWKRAKPFNVSDSLAIKEKLYEAYKKTIEAYEKKHIDFIWTAYLDADVEWYQSEYFDAGTIENFQRKFMRRGKTYIYGRARVDIEGVKFYPLEDFNIAFYCDNKIACLEFSSGRFKGESKFAYQTVASLGRNEVQFFDLFYMQDPESKDGKLIIVR